MRGESTVARYLRQPLFTLLPALSARALERMHELPRRSALPDAPAPALLQRLGADTVMLPIEVAHPGQQ
jgi:hypothetical protein